MTSRLSMASAGLRRVIGALGRGAPHVIFDGIGFAGAGAIAYGAWLVYAPAGYLVGGALAMGLSVLFGRKLEASGK